MARVAPFPTTYARASVTSLDGTVRTKRTRARYQRRPRAVNLRELCVDSPERDPNHCAAMNLDLWLEALSARRLLLATHLLVWIVLAAYGLHRLHLIRLYRRRERSPRRPAAPTDWPVVTMQLPIYDERYVVERLLDAAAAVDYPRDRLEIQVLDDSTDETTAIAVVSSLESSSTWISRSSRG